MSRCGLLPRPSADHPVLKEPAVSDKGWVRVEDNPIAREDDANWAFWLNAWGED